MDGKTEILDGLRPGEAVVVMGSCLVKSSKPGLGLRAGRDLALLARPDVPGEPPRSP